MIVLKSLNIYATPFYLFTAIELVAAFLIMGAVREPTEKEV